MGARARVLIYSHDSFGLGHIRRCRTIAHALAETYRGLEVLILSGSPIIGSFDFKARVDFVRVPGLIKLRNGEYESLAKHRSVAQTTRLRAALIGEAALNFDPHIVIVDKEPLGLRGELEATLHALKARGARLVLGLRDVLDSVDALAAEWARKNAIAALDEIYDAIWIYGLEEIYNPLAGLTLPPSIRAKTRYTGYLRRNARAAALSAHAPLAAPGLIITPGGGGDGVQMIDSLITAYERHGAALSPALFVLGPFMPTADRAGFQSRIESLRQKTPLHTRCIVFDARMENWMQGASGVAAMGGYNTFCEILSFDKPALLMPRRTPRMEQTIRARRAAALGLAGVFELPDEGPADPDAVAAALAQIVHRPPPSAAGIAGLLDGLDRIATIVRPWLDEIGANG
jgi:predicted glycosyltransferase